MCNFHGSVGVPDSFKTHCLYSNSKKSVLHRQLISLIIRLGSLLSHQMFQCIGFWKSEVKICGRWSRSCRVISHASKITSRSSFKCCSLVLLLCRLRKKRRKCRKCLRKKKSNECPRSFTDVQKLNVGRSTVRFKITRVSMCILDVNIKSIQKIRVGLLWLS